MKISLHFHVDVRTHECCSGVGWSAAPWTTLKKALHLVVDTVSGSEPDDIAYVTSGCVGAFAGYEWCCLSPSRPLTRISLCAGSLQWMYCMPAILGSYSLLHSPMRTLQSPSVSVCICVAQFSCPKLTGVPAGVQPCVPPLRLCACQLHPLTCVDWRVGACVPVCGACVVPV